jgi:hypothetical protein
MQENNMHDREPRGLCLVCGTCGSSRVRVDLTGLTGVWDAEAQELRVDSWESESAGWCLDCGGDDYIACDIMYVPAHDKVL